MYLLTIPEATVCWISVRRCPWEFLIRCGGNEHGNATMLTTGRRDACVWAVVQFDMMSIRGLPSFSSFDFGTQLHQSDERAAHSKHYLDMGVSVRAVERRV